MTVVDVNTGRFTGQGGNLEETVTKNNLEAAEETVRQLRLRDVGGIIVIDFIDMVLESNRDLVVRRLIECLGRDRTKHQVAEVTSLGLVQMTRKRVGQGLMETFSEPCECCNGRGEKVHAEPVSQRSPERRIRPTRPPGAHDPAEVAARAANGAGEADSIVDGEEATDEGLEPTPGVEQAKDQDVEVNPAPASQPDEDPAPASQPDEVEPQSDSSHASSDDRETGSDSSTTAESDADRKEAQERGEFDQSQETP